MSEECGYEGQLLDRTSTTSWVNLSIEHPLARARAERLGEELDGQGVLRWKIGLLSAARITLSLHAQRTTSRLLRRRHSIFKTWLEPTVRVADDREWLEGPVRAALARAGLADAVVLSAGEQWES